MANFEQWRVLRVRFGFEALVARQLRKQGIEAFLPQPREGATAIGVPATFKTPIDLLFSEGTDCIHAGLLVNGIIRGQTHKSSNWRSKLP